MILLELVYYLAEIIATILHIRKKAMRIKQRNRLAAS